MMKVRLVVVFIALWAMTIACSTQAPNDLRRPKSIPNNVQFIAESNPDWVGSYCLIRIREGYEWEECGNWTSTEILFTGKGPTVCFGGYKSDAIFRADEHHQWVVIKKEDTQCLRLEKK